MPQLFRIGPYVIYFWSNEGNPLEPIHVHIAENRATANGTKIWITSTGHVLKANNQANIPDRILNTLMKMIEANSEEIIERWKAHFGEVSFYC